MSEKTKTRRSKGNGRAVTLGRRCQGVEVRSFWLALFFDISMPPRSNAGEGNRNEFNSRAEEDGGRARQVRKEKGGDGSIGS